MIVQTFAHGKFVEVQNTRGWSPPPFDWEKYWRFGHSFLQNQTFDSVRLALDWLIFSSIAILLVFIWRRVRLDGSVAFAMNCFGFKCCERCESWLPRLLASRHHCGAIRDLRILRLC